MPHSENTILNVPNQLTIARLILAIVCFVLIPLERHVAALIVFLLAAGTDWIDGYYARKYGQVTKLGRILDPFVDKILICGVFIFLAAEPGSGILAWMAVVVVGREMLVTALRGFIEQGGGDFSAQLSGKLKMVFQCAAVVASLWALAEAARVATGGAPGAWAALVLPIGLPLCVWAALLATVYSGVEYIVAAARLLRQ